MLTIDGAGAANYRTTLRIGTHNVRAIYVGAGSFNGGFRDSHSEHLAPPEAALGGFLALRVGGPGEDKQIPEQFGGPNYRSAIMIFISDS